MDHHLGLVWLPDDALAEIVEGPRCAGQPETLAAAAMPVEPPEGSKGTLTTSEGWPRLMWQSDLAFSPVQGWDDAELAVETLLCALSVAPAAERGLRPMLLAALKARYAKVVKDPDTYPPGRCPWAGRSTPGEDMLEYLRGWRHSRGAFGFRRRLSRRAAAGVRGARHRQRCPVDTRWDDRTTCAPSDPGSRMAPRRSAPVRCGPGREP